MFACDIKSKNLLYSLQNQSYLISKDLTVSELKTESWLGATTILDVRRKAVKIIPHCIMLKKKTVAKLQGYVQNV